MITILFCLVYLKIIGEDTAIQNLFCLFEKHPLVALITLFELLNEVKIVFI